MQGSEVVADSDRKYLVLDRSVRINLLPSFSHMGILIRANRCLQIVEVGWNIGSTLQVAFHHL